MYNGHIDLVKYRQIGKGCRYKLKIRAGEGMTAGGA